MPDTLVQPVFTGLPQWHMAHARIRSSSQLRSGQRPGYLYMLPPARELGRKVQNPALWGVENFLGPAYC